MGGKFKDVVNPDGTVSTIQSISHTGFFHRGLVRTRIWDCDEAGLNCIEAVDYRGENPSVAEQALGPASTAAGAIGGAAVLGTSFPDDDINVSNNSGSSSGATAGASAKSSSSSKATTSQGKSHRH